MGSEESKPPPPPPLLSEPWRTIHRGDNQRVLQHVKDYNPPTEGQHIRILLYGPVGAGKSSFINSVQSVLQGKMCSQALVADTCYASVTRQFLTYTIPKEDGKSFYPFVFNDMKGLERRDGVLVDDVKLALRGNMRDGYEFNPASKLSEDDPFYNNNPNTNDRVHVLVLVIDANFVSVMMDEIVQEIRDIRSEASDLGIPQVAIFTKIDEACPEIKTDLKKVYKVQHLKRKMEQFSADVGIPMNCIFPVKNYHEQIKLNSDVDSLILSVLREIINYGDDYINLKKILSEPWRTIHWGDSQSALQHVKDYNPPTEGQHIRILLHGPVGAGKSSFINSVHSVLRGRMYRQALVDNTSSTSFTRQFTTYKIPKENRLSFYPFVFNDIMGLERSSGVLVDDVKLALRGNMRDGYEFNPASKLSEDDPSYNKNPNTNDRVHVLVLVIDANTVSMMNSEILQKIRDIRSEASDLRIPQVAIFTKIDETCPEIKKDLKKVYEARFLKEKMEQFSANVGIPINCIFPVKNYHEEINLNSDVDSLILSAMTEMIHCGDDYINLKKSNDRLTCFNKI